MSFTLGFDAIAQNISHLPPGHQAAGYVTGTDGTGGTLAIKWSDAELAAHPGVIRIDQSPVLTGIDETADVLDIENGAATIAEAATWYKAALANYFKAARPGQRHPAMYCSQSNVTPLVNQLTADGVKSGPNLWVANWSDTQSEAIAAVLGAGGPYPIIGIQFFSGAFIDFDVFDVGWLAKVSAPTTTPPKQPQAISADGVHSFGSQVQAKGTSVERALWLMARDGANNSGNFGGFQQAIINASDLAVQVPAKGTRLWVG